ncbi:MAG: UMP kinase [Symbiobacteriaceae bacterium]|nr:UMP kinase [Symbiobacteriaceae bacterium]
MPSSPIYKRVLLKLSGEALSGSAGFGYDAKVIDDMALQVKNAQELGVEIAIVIGGGNLWRGDSGSKKLGLERANADHMGMLATIMNGLAFQGALERHGVPCRVQSAIEMRPVCETYIRQRAHKHLQQGIVVIFVGGTGSPFFSTDTTAALRAAEINADVIIKGTQVDGVYNADPRQDPEATRFSTISHQEYLERGLQVLDLTAISLCRENNIPVIVLNIADEQSLRHALLGENVGTVIGGS